MLKRLSLLALGFLVTVVALLFVATNRQPSDEELSELPLIAATTFPLYDIARNVAGETARVELVLPVGASPHTFEPRPSDLKRLQGANIVYATALDLMTGLIR